MAAATAATDNARPRNGLLAGTGRLRRRLRFPRRFAILVTARLFAARRPLSSSSFFLRDAVAGAAAGFSSATQVSPFKVSPDLHSIGQTRVVCLVNSATSASVTLTLWDGCPSIVI